MNEEHVTALTQLMEAFEKAKAAFAQAKMKQGEGAGVAEEAHFKVDDIADQAEMAEEAKEEVDEYLAQIEQLIVALENQPDPEIEDDKEAEDAADDCDEAEKEGAQAVESAIEKVDVVHVKTVAIEQEGDKSSGSSAAAIENFEKAGTALEAAQGASGDVEALE
jgi:seryl-tRNA synthetase